MCLQKFIMNEHSWNSWQKKIDTPKMLFLKAFWSAFFFHDFHEWYFGMKFASTENICQSLHQKRFRFSIYFTFFAGKLVDLSDRGTNQVRSEDSIYAVSSESINAVLLSLNRSAWAVSYLKPINNSHKYIALVFIYTQAACLVNLLVASSDCPHWHATSALASFFFGV